MVREQAREALLDDAPKDACRRRVTALRAAVAAAEDRGELEGAERAQAELDVLLGELRRAVGLGGRDGPVADDAERARVAARKAFAAALTRLAEHDPSFAAHLRAAVRTGLRCSYEPDPTAPVRWQVA